MNKKCRILNQKNNAREEAISEKNDEVYTDMILYLNGSDISDYDREKVREDIIEMILDGQERGDDIEQIMGGNYKQICDEILEAVPKKTVREKIFYYTELAANMLIICLLLHFFYRLLRVEGGSAWHIDFTAGMLLSDAILVITSVTAADCLCKGAFRGFLEKRNGNIKAVLILFAVGCIAISLMAASRLILTRVLFSLPLWVLAIAAAVLFGAGRILAEWE